MLGIQGYVSYWMKYRYSDEDCRVLSEKTKWVSLTNSEEAKFIIVILTRVLETMDGFTLVGNKISSTETIMIRLYLNTPVPIF